jgi:hypothetical protein
MIVPTPSSAWPKVCLRVAQLRAGGHRVWLVKEAPLQAFSPPYRLTRLAMLDRPVDDVGLAVEAHHKRQVFISQLFAQLAQEDPACAWSIRRRGCAMKTACATPNSAAIRCTPMTITCPKSVRGLWRRSSSRCLWPASPGKPQAQTNAAK